MYALYAADPHRPTNALTEMVYLRGRIEDTRSPRVGLAAGGRFGVLRIDPGTAGGRSWQVSISAGLDVVFDSDHKLDAVGWDGNYGFLDVGLQRGRPSANPTIVGRGQVRTREGSTATADTGYRLPATSAIAP